MKVRRVSHHFILFWVAAYLLGLPFAYSTDTDTETELCKEVLENHSWKYYVLDLYKGRKMDGWVLEKKIASTKTSNIWLAHSEAPPHLKVALKFIVERAHFPFLYNEYSIRRRAQEETGLSTKHGILSLRGYNFSEPPYIAVDYIEGESLSDYYDTDKNASFSIPEALSHIEKILTIIAHVHMRGIAHLDIKPANFHYSQEGNSFLLDFGLSKFVDDEYSLSDSFFPAGTFRYAPEEQLSHNVDPSKINLSSDVFALGVLFDELPIRTMAFSKSEKTAIGTLEQFIRKACSEYQPHRFSSAIEMLKELRRIKREYYENRSYFDQVLKRKRGRLGYFKQPRSLCNQL